MSSSPWHEFRRQGITSTDAVGILAADCEREGVEVYSSPLQVWLDKKGLRPDIEETEAMYWGTRLEPLLVEEFCKRTGHEDNGTFGMVCVDILKDDRDAARWVLSRKDWPARCTPDAFYGHRDHGDVGILECKTTGFRNAEKWRDLPPVPAQIQAQWHLYVSGLEHGALVCLIGGQRFVGYEFTRNDRFIDRVLVPRCKEFWERNVLGDVEPAPMAQDLDVVRTLAGKDNGQTVQLPEEAIAVDVSYTAAKMHLKAEQAIIDAREAQLIRWIGEHTFGEIPGLARYSYTTQQRGETQYRQLRRKPL